MALLPFDELNTPKVEVEPPEEYFSKMAISKEQKEERVDTANDFLDVLLFFFALLSIEMDSDNPDYNMAYMTFRQRFVDVIGKHSQLDDYQRAFADEYTQMQFELTKRYLEAAGYDSQSAIWWTSPERAMAISESAANIVLNHEELRQAFNNGAVKKRWIRIYDNKLRETHRDVTKKTIPLTEYFAVGKGIMMHPLDWENNAKECYRCRCACHYFDKEGNLVKVGGKNEDI